MSVFRRTFITHCELYFEPLSKVVPEALVQPAGDQNGQPSAEPDVWALVISTPGETVVVALDEGGRQNLLRKLNRGVIIAPTLQAAGLS